MHAHAHGHAHTCTNTPPCNAPMQRTDHQATLGKFFEARDTSKLLKGQLFDMGEVRRTCIVYFWPLQLTN